MRNGLEDLPNEAAIALIHDAARPIVEHELIERLLAAARSGQCAVPGLPLADTIKEVGEDGRVTRTLDRTKLWRVQTPQAFPRADIERAHREARAANVSATDDAALCERIGVPVTIVPGSERALKVTTESDFARVEALFARAR